MKSPWSHRKGSMPSKSKIFQAVYVTSCINIYIYIYIIIWYYMYNRTASNIEVNGMFSIKYKSAWFSSLTSIQLIEHIYFSQPTHLWSPSLDPSNLQLQDFVVNRKVVNQRWLLGPFEVCRFQILLFPPPPPTRGDLIFLCQDWEKQWGKVYYVRLSKMKVSDEMNLFWRKKHVSLHVQGEVLWARCMCWRHFGINGSDLIGVKGKWLAMFSCQESTTSPDRWTGIPISKSSWF